jgi:hypothetical protein
MFNYTFNNISPISWPSVLLVEETEVTGETTDLSQFTEKSLSHNVVSSTPPHEQEYELTTLALRGTDSAGSGKTIYHTNHTITTAPSNVLEIIEMH